MDFSELVSETAQVSRMEKLIRCLEVAKKLIEIALLLWDAARRLDL